MTRQGTGPWECGERKITELIVDFRKEQREHPPMHIDGTVVERVVSFKFLTSRTN